MIGCGYIFAFESHPLQGQFHHIFLKTIAIKWKLGFNEAVTLQLMVSPYLCNFLIMSFNNLWYILSAAVTNFNGVRVKDFM